MPTKEDARIAALHWGQFLSTVPTGEAAASTLEDLLRRVERVDDQHDGPSTGSPAFPSRRRLGRLLAGLVRQGQVERKGSGLANDPFRYWRRPDSTSL